MMKMKFQENFITHQVFLQEINKIKTKIMGQMKQEKDKN